MSLHLIEGEVSNGQICVSEVTNREYRVSFMPVGEVPGVVGPGNGFLTDSSKANYVSNLSELKKS